MAGVRGKSVRVLIAARVKGRVIWVVGSRQGAVPVKLFGAMVKVIA